MSGRGRGRGGGGGGRGPDGGRGGGRGRGRGGGGGGRGTPETQAAGLNALGRTLQGLHLSVPTAEKLPNGLAKRPSLGTVGRRVALFANHFLIRFNRSKAYHYDVDVQSFREQRVGEAEAVGPRAARVVPLPQSVCRKAVAAVAQQQHWPEGWTYDGKKNLYTCDDILPRMERTFEVEIVEGEGERPRKFTVKTQWAKEVDLMALNRYLQHGGPEYPQAAVQSLETALRHGAAMKPNVITSGRALYFYDPQHVQPVGFGAEVWLGYHQSLRPCQFGLALNIDTAATAFLQRRSAVDVLAEAIGARDPRQIGQLDGQAWSKMNRAIRGLVVRELHRPGQVRKRRVKGITRTPASHTMFEVEGEGQISVAEYFKKTYRALNLPALPCLDFSTPTRVTYLPPEACEIVQGQRRKKLNEQQTSNMMRAAAQKPNDRKAYINDVLLNKAQLHRDSSIKKFGIEVNPKMVEVEGRILPQPHLEYRQPECLDVGTQGAWNLENVQLYGPATIQSWVLLNLVNPRQVEVQGEGGIHQFSNDLVRSLKAAGMNTPEALPIHNGDLRRGGVLPCMQGAKQLAEQKYGKKPNIIFVLLPRKEAQLYKEVKRASDSQVGIPSQCIVSRTALDVQRGNKRLQYCANIAMKVNAKVGGKNCKIVGASKAHFPVVGERPFIIFGADVTHPTSDDTTEPSVAGLVASVDAFATRFAARVIFQKHRQEIIDLKDSAKELLREFYASTHYKPERIIYYRDGVSEGQFQTVLEAEYNELRQACRELGDPSAEYCPPITFVVVQKRHHTRLFPAQNEGDRSGNVLPGTIVDKGIGHPFEFDFFLNSHAGIQGTNKPAHYHVLVDENKFSADGIALMTFWLCFLYCRCTRSVSYCPPAYYAHLAAFRGKIMAFSSDSSSDTGSAGGPVERLRISGDLHNTMYFV